MDQQMSIPGCGLECRTSGPAPDLLDPNLQPTHRILHGCSTLRSSSLDRQVSRIFLEENHLWSSGNSTEFWSQLPDISIQKVWGDWSEVGPLTLAEGTLEK